MSPQATEVRFFPKLSKRPGLVLALGVSLLMGGVAALATSLQDGRWNLAAAEGPGSVPPGTTGPISASAAGPASQPGSQKVTPAEAKALLKEYAKAQKTELRNFQQRMKQQLSELEASQRKQREDWDRRERDARRKFFTENSKGAAKRAYIQDLKARREAFFKNLKEEWSTRQHEQEVHLKALKEDQRSRLMEFQEALGRGERPAAGLWASG